jgi:hypothetical protein
MEKKRYGGIGVANRVKRRKCILRSGFRALLRLRRYRRGKKGYRDIETTDRKLMKYIFLFNGFIYLFFAYGGKCYYSSKTCTFLATYLFLTRW